MAHNLEMINRKASMFYFGEDTWHGLGTRVHRALTAEEALVEAKLNYKVVSGQLVYNDGNNNVIIHDKRANYRTDTGQYLGTVGNRYSILQNKDAFSFFDELISRDEAVYHTAGVLNNGSTVWILAKMPEDIIGADGEKIKDYILLSNSHNGSSMVQALITPIRVVCNNTLNFAIEGAQNKISIRHSGDITSKVKNAHTLLNIHKKYIDKFQLLTYKLHDVKCSEEILNKFTIDLFPDSESKNQTRVKNLRNELRFSIMHGGGQNIDHSLYWLYNGAVRYFDNDKQYKDDTTKLKNVWFNPINKNKVSNKINLLYTKLTGQEL